MKKEYIELAQAIRNMKKETYSIPCGNSTKQVIKRKFQIVVDKVGYLISVFDSDFDMDEFNKMVNHRAYFTHHTKQRKYLTYVGKKEADTEK